MALWDTCAQKSEPKGDWDLNNAKHIKFIKGASPKQRSLVKALSIELNGKPISSRELKGMSQKKAGFLISDLKKRIRKKSPGKIKKSRTGIGINGRGGVPTSEKVERSQSSQDKVGSSQERRTKVIVRRKNGSTRTVQKVVTSSE